MSDKHQILQTSRKNKLHTLLFTFTTWVFFLSFSCFWFLIVDQFTFVTKVIELSFISLILTTYKIYVKTMLIMNCIYNDGSTWYVTKVPRPCLFSKQIRVYIGLHGHFIYLMINFPYYDITISPPFPWLELHRYTWMFGIWI